MRRVPNSEDELKSDSHEGTEMRQNEAGDDADAVFESELRGVLYQVQLLAPENPPHLNLISRLIQDTKRRQIRSLWRDLTLFIIVGIFVCAGWFISVTLNYLFDVLIVTTLLSIAAIPAFWMLTRREEKAS